MLQDVGPGEYNHLKFHKQYSHSRVWHYIQKLEMEAYRNPSLSLREDTQDTPRLSSKATIFSKQEVVDVVVMVT